MSTITNPNYEIIENCDQQQQQFNDESHSINSSIVIRIVSPNQTALQHPLSRNRDLLANITAFTERTRGGAPPSYEEAIDTNSVPPPSYDSLFGRVRQAQKQSNGPIEFIRKLIILLLGTIGISFVFVVTVAAPISMIVIGSLYFQECPQSEYIPVYLLIGGLMGLLKPLLALSTRVRSREEQAQERMRQSGNQSLINWFMFGWFLIGSYFVYREYEPNYDPSSGRYCNRTLYLFAFWLITSVYLVTGIVIASLFIITVIVILLRETGLSSNTNTNTSTENENS